MFKHKMLNKKSTFTQNITNKKGQVALFVALIFQILFLFFAMVINVGLLVHHKINLQNSVDLAAYYGAARQAEGMNVVAHANYQIRQAWKLLAWRYRMIGSAGEWFNHPYSKVTKSLTSAAEQDTVNTSNSVINDFQEAPAFCITYIPFQPMPPGENTCRNMATKSGISLFRPTAHIAAHEGFSGALRKASILARNSAINRCKIAGVYNYLALARFMVSYNVYQADRMTFINSMSNALSVSESDFYDLDGASAAGGIQKTFLNNLTTANRAAFETEGSSSFEVYNSLGNPNCAKSGGQHLPAKWLQPIKVFPGFSYIDSVCGNNDQLSIEGKEINGTNLPYHVNDSIVSNEAAMIKELVPYIGYKSDVTDVYNFSLGVEKNPWCMAYVGVKAEARPSIPFSPFGKVKISARAFYKPFGGRIGPWYHKQWPRGSTTSTGSNGEKIDALVPPRIADLANLGSIATDREYAKVRAANYSRFVGDEFGLKTFMMLGYWGKAVFDLSTTWQTDRSASVDGSGSENNSAYSENGSPNFNDWAHLPFDVNLDGGAHDLLAWDSANNRPTPMRRLELTAILPDTFDMAYYSIQPDFYHTYYKRIMGGNLPAVSQGIRKLHPDIGYHKGYKTGNFNLDEFSIKNQYEAMNEPGYLLKDVVAQKFTYLSTNWKHTLTGWMPVNFLNYDLDASRFGRCTTEHNPARSPASGGCAVGGSTGYGVKLVSSDYLNSADLVLGGSAGGNGPLLNPPPSDW